LAWQNEQRGDKSKLAPRMMSCTLADADTWPKGTQIIFAKAAAGATRASD
jgi:hypothetical protein